MLFRVVSNEWYEEQRAMQGAQTFHELLAGVFLVEGSMLNRATEVVDHEVEGRPDVLFGVAGVVNEQLVLDTMISRR